TFSVAHPGPSSEPPVVIPLPDIQLPEPPAPIQPPALPMISAEAPEQVTIPSTRFEHNPPELLPPPPNVIEEPGGFEPLAPNMVAPRLRNPDEVERTLRRNYPPILRDAGIGGTVNAHTWLDEDGEIVRSRIGQSSGHPSLDEAALRVGEIMRIAPALDRDRAVRVIVNLPIEFKARCAPPCATRSVGRHTCRGVPRTHTDAARIALRARLRSPSV